MKHGISQRPHALIRTALSTLLGLALAAPAALPAADPPAATFSFHFAPPDGTRVQQTVHTVVEKTVTGQPSHRDETEATVHGVYRHVDGGYRYTTTTEGFVFRHDGKSVTNPIAELVVKAPLSYLLGLDGQASAIDGLSGLGEKLKTSFPPEVALPVLPALPFLEENALVAHEKEDWNSRYAHIANATFRIGDSFDGRGSYPLPDGSQLEYTIHTRFVGWESCPAGSCVRVEIRYDSRSDGQPTAPDTATGTKRLTGQTRRLIDPDTMRIYAEHFERTVTTLVTLKSQGPVPATRHEERSYDYRYE
jgi:hypothetical protein